MKNLLMSLSRMGRVDEALDLARRARHAWEKVGIVSGLLDPFAMIAVHQGRYQDAARMLGHADAVVRDSSLREGVEQQLREQVWGALTSVLPAAELDRLMQAGAALSVNAALDLAFV